ncbi:efflux RND transporter periplasmic adaptor subunit [Roseinatronobacter sp. S2]|uniref:efflux RND transporter periplasmic adaptor subunit n=1 Tax=Roseinatronobacter sp. S2 TaxID=3035471 RepID=UPI00240F6BD8|nr:efflux RND transporter periplasmic adaptor subunit [Roseinatronobacter sp. S2]WFE77098.1 efflux RND transporter periplasmic adaptor subunit [Roseinatronobacter sp. S2]
MSRFSVVFVLATTLMGVSAMPLAAQETLRPVKVTTVTAQEPWMTRQFFGQVVARQTVDLAFQVGGQIMEFPVTEGQTLAKGDMIARLDVETFDLQLQQARLQQDEADRAAARLRRLSGSAASEVSLENAETQAQLAALSVRDAETRLRHATLLAPFDSLVASRRVANFSTISAGTPVVRLHDMSELRIEINVPEVLFRRPDDRDAIEFFAEFPGNSTPYPLAISEFDAEASAIGQTFRLSLALQSTDGLSVLPGSSATVTARVQDGLQGVLLPASAVGINPDGTTYVLVFEADADGTGPVRRMPVTVQPADDGRVIVTDGLEDGLEIVEAGLPQLQDGQRVRRFSGFGN